MTPFASEFLGTAVYVFLGVAVTANMRLARAPGVGGSYATAVLGWGAALAAGLLVAGRSDAQLNPAVTVAMWSIGRLQSGMLSSNITAQCAGAFVGAAVAWLQFLPYWSRTDDSQTKLAVFVNVPRIRAPLSNLLSEVLASAVFVYVILRLIAGASIDAGGADQLEEGVAFQLTATPISVVQPILSILIAGMALAVIALGAAGASDCIMNPARDLGSRVAHAFLPIPGKDGSDWRSAWIGIVGPVLGALLAAMLWRATVG
ncbi:MAG: aquaporin family protein [Planctomycetota bacterium]|nr:aquaporin family protein [Planctomycetota bacterium]